VGVLVDCQIQMVQHQTQRIKNPLTIGVKSTATRKHEWVHVSTEKGVLIKKIYNITGGVGEGFLKGITVSHRGDPYMGF